MKITKYISRLFVLAILAACGDDDGNEIEPSLTDGLTEVVSEPLANSDYTVMMYIDEDKTLQVGYNTYSLGLMDSEGNHVHNAHMSVTPMMTMMEMSHSAPAEEFAHDMGSHTLQEFATVFVMPSGEMGNWTLNVTVHVMDENFEGSVSLPVEVGSPAQSKLVSHNMGDQGSLFISLVDPVSPEVGMNNFEVAIHKRENMMSWPAVTDYTVSIEPEMPAMGHGSPNNIDPTHDALGHYKGEVNFTMTGEWVVHVTISDGIEVVTEADFEIVF